MAVIDNLKKEFINATDYRGPIKKDAFFNREFASWLRSRMEILSNYIE